MYCNPARLLWRYVLTQCTSLWTAPALLLLLCLALDVQAASRTPASDNEVLEKLPTRAGDSTSRELNSLRAALAQAPTDEAAATELVRRYFDLAMASGDPRYIGYADAVVRRFPGASSAPLLTLRGMLRQYRHDFAGALSDLDAALKQDPSHADAHAWRGAIFLVKADPAAAQQACDGLQRLGRDVLAGGCLGLTEAYGGQLDVAYQTLQKALDQAGFPDNQLWLLTRLGEVAAWRGQPTQAEAHYRAALALGRDDVYLLAAWADFLLDAGQPAEVVKWLQPWKAADGLLLRLAEAETALQLPGAARHRQMLADRFAAARARGDTTHRAEEARFELRLRQDPKTAVRLAAENYAVQREPRDARILLEAAIAAKDPASAQPARDWLRSSGFEDARTRRLGQLSGGDTATGATTGSTR
jgi:tetratricopeptide (TPR) repeat protein